MPRTKGILLRMHRISIRPHRARGQAILRHATDQMRTASNAPDLNQATSSQGPCGKRQAKGNVTRYGLSPGREVRRGPKRKAKQKTTSQEMDSAPGTRFGAGPTGGREKRPRGAKKGDTKKNVTRIYTPFGTRRNQPGTRQPVRSF